MLWEGGYQYGFVLKRDHRAVVETWSKVFRDDRFRGKVIEEEEGSEIVKKFVPGIIQLVKQLEDNGATKEDSRQTTEAADMSDDLSSWYCHSYQLGHQQNVMNLG